MSRQPADPLPRRIAQIDPAVFNTVVREFEPLLEAARLHRAGMNGDTLKQVHHALATATSGTADGRWLAACMLLQACLRLLRNLGLGRPEEVRQHLSELALCPPGTAPQVIARFEQSMTLVLHFLDAWYGNDTATQQELTRDRDSDLLYSLTGLVVSFCAPVQS